MPDVSVRAHRIGAEGPQVTAAGELWLASTSPRRRDLLERAGIAFRLAPPGPEPLGGAGAPAELAVERAVAKATGAVLPPGARGRILGVDTVVDCDGVELGKPRDRAEAEAFLRALAGRVHHVHTALALVPATDRKHARTAVAHAGVRIAPLGESALARYLDSELWQGKAGAYGIQDDGAGVSVELVDGARDTVIGLPIRVLAAMLGESERDPSGGA